MRIDPSNWRFGEQMKNGLFNIISRLFPTSKISDNKLLAVIWRLCFYLICPTKPFRMQIKYYELIVYPEKNSLTRAVIRRGYWEPLQTEIFVKHINAGSMVVDAGANFGHYTLVASKFVGPKGLVFSFEPHRNTFNILRENCQLLDMTNIKPIPAALGESNKTKLLYIDDGNPGGHSFLKDNVRRFSGEIEKIDLFSLDSFLANNAPRRRLNVLKIDVQGYEMQTLMGGYKSIKEFRPVVFCEVTPSALLKAGSNHKQLIEFFDELDYTAIIINEKSNKTVTIANNDLVERLTHTKSEYFDVLFSPL